MAGGSVILVVINGVGRAMTMRLQVRLLVRTLSGSVRGVSNLASLSARTYRAQVLPALASSVHPVTRGERSGPATEQAQQADVIWGAGDGVDS